MSEWNILRSGKFLLPFTFFILQGWQTNNVLLSDNDNEHSGQKTKNDYKIESLKVRKEFINPLLEEILSNEMHCNIPVDDEQAFIEFKSTSCPPEDPKYFINGWSGGFRDGFIWPERERQIQEQSLGHCPMGILNRTRIQVWLNIYKKYPCTETSILAINEIIGLLSSSDDDYLQFVEVDGKEVLSFQDEILALMHYEKITFLNSWEVHVMEPYINMLIYGEYSLERIISERNLLFCIEDLDLMNNKYFNFQLNLIYFNNNKTAFLISRYDELLFLILHRGNELAENDISNDEKLHQETIQLYKMHHELVKRRNKKYLEYKPEPKCAEPALYQYVRKYAPWHYRLDLDLMKACWHENHRFFPPLPHEEPPPPSETNPPPPQSTSPPSSQEPEEWGGSTN
jgi:hypothetical protein